MNLGCTVAVFPQDASIGQAVPNLVTDLLSVTAVFEVECEQKDFYLVSSAVAETGRLAQVYS